MTDDDKSNKYVSLDTIAAEQKTMLAEIQELQKKVIFLRKEKATDDSHSEACLIMVMKLEVAFLLVSKLFSDGVVDTLENFEFAKKDENKKP